MHWPRGSAWHGSHLGYIVHEYAFLQGERAVHDGCAYHICWDDDAEPGPHGREPANTGKKRHSAEFEQQNGLHPACACSVFTQFLSQCRGTCAD